MGIVTGQWRASIGSWHARFKFQLPGADTNSISASPAIFYALVLAVLLMVGGVELNPGPNTQSCCELCGVNLDSMKEKELALDQREEAVLVMLQQREAACDAREQCLERREALLQSREAAVRRREKLVAEKEKSSRTPAANREPGGVEVVKTLLEKEMISKTGLLQWAVLNSYMSIARFLIEEAKVDVDTKDSSGRSVLFLAVERGLLSAVELLLPLSTEVVVTDNTGRLAFHLAVREGHTDVVKCLVHDSPALARKRNNNHDTALHVAAENGHLEIVKFLIREVQADVHVKRGDGWTALHLAARNGHLDAVKYLVLEAHCDVDVKKYDGWTALHHAAFHSRFSVAEFLVQEARADVDSKTSSGKTALQLSSSTEMKNLLRRCS